VIQVLKSFFQSCLEGVLTLPEPLSGIVIFFIRNLGAFWISNLGFQKIHMFTHIITDSLSISELQIGINIHFNNAVSDGLPDLLHCGTTSTMEYKIDRILSYTIFF